MELEILSGQLSDPARLAQTKLDAALQLLTRPYPQASQVLCDFLTRTDNLAARIAVAKAIAHHGGKNKAFIKPLMSMLTGKEPSVRAPAAMALAAYKNHGVLRKLIVIVRDRKQDRAVRLVIISAMQSMLDKRAVDTLVRLLDDREAAIRESAAASLAKLTNIRAFGNDRIRWKNWWKRNKNKPHSVWLADLADSLARAKSNLETDNARLRDRLAKAMQDIYSATPAQRKSAMLVSFVKDPLADVRMVGLSLAQRKIAGGQDISAELKTHILAMCADEDPRVRRAVALLVGNMSDKKAPVILLSRLKAEEVHTVRQGLLTALGQLRSAGAIPACLKEISSTYEGVSAAAAIALARIVSKHPLSDKQRDQAAKALVQRYHHNGLSTDGALLREALLTAMGAIKHKAAAGVLQEALKDSAATVRLAAVNGLKELGDSLLAAALEPLVSDTDRGVRQAAIVAIGKLDGPGRLKTILLRTSPKIETDAAVRKQAWDVTMSVLAHANSGVLWEVSQSLAKRPDASQQRIKVAQLLVAALKAEKSKKLHSAQRQLAKILMKASRPAEAATHLAQAYDALKKAKDKDAAAVWLMWVDSLLAADDPAVIKVISDQAESKSFKEAGKRLEKFLKDLLAGEKYSQTVRTASLAIKQLGKRLGATQKLAIEKILSDATAKQASADRKKVSNLVSQLLGTDSAAADAAKTELKTLGDRAVAPLLQILKKTVEQEKPDTKTEKAILDILTQIAPKLSGYDPNADKPTRLKKINAWITNQTTPTKTPPISKST